MKLYSGFFFRLEATIVVMIQFLLSRGYNDINNRWKFIHTKGSIDCTSYQQKTKQQIHNFRFDCIWDQCQCICFYTISLLTAALIQLDYNFIISFSFIHCIIYQQTAMLSMFTFMKQKVLFDFRSNHAHKNVNASSNRPTNLNQSLCKLYEISNFPILCIDIHNFSLKHSSEDTFNWPNTPLLIKIFLWLLLFVFVYFHGFCICAY